MAFTDALFPLFTYPNRSPDPALEKAASLAARLSCGVTAVALKIRIRTLNNRLANLLTGMDEQVREENLKTAGRAGAVIGAWRDVADRMNIATDSHIETLELGGEAEFLVQAARTRDLCLMAIGPDVEADVAAAEAVLFGSGRPVLIFPEAGPLTESLDHMTIAWDGSRAAARAVADAMPVLVAARRVRVIAVTGDDPVKPRIDGAEICRHLEAHGIAPAFDTVDAGERPVGSVFDDEMARSASDLLVMGGFGHSRSRDFILGGTTRRVLKAPRYPVFLAH